MPKQVIVQSSIEAVEIIDTPIPTAKAKQIVVKVVVSGTNPKDWKYPLWKSLPHNSGDDLAGIVESVGIDVYEFKPGDRVAALHAPATENGSFAEYAVVSDWTTFHLPQNISFEEAATIPTAALTAAVGLYSDMRLPAPYDSTELARLSGQKVPILIYGITSAVGAFAAKFARLSGLGPVIGVSGRARNFAETLADYVVDYRMGEDALVVEIQIFLTKEGLGVKIPFVFDAISENGSLEATLRIIDSINGVVSTALPPQLFAKNKEDFKYPPGVKAINSILPQVFWDHKDFGYIWSRYLSRLLADGRLKAHPYEVIPGGLNGILTGLQKLKDGQASGVKYVYRIDDTGVTTLGVQGKDGQPVSRQDSQEPHPLSAFPFPSTITE